MDSLNQSEVGSVVCSVFWFGLFLEGGSIELYHWEAYEITAGHIAIFLFVLTLRKILSYPGWPRTHYGAQEDIKPVL